jgi:hypothetical protein
MGGKTPFVIHLHAKDLALLERIQSFFGVGSLSGSKRSIRYQVQSVKDLTNIIIPHFDKYPLLAKKQADFLLFKSIVESMIRKEHLTTEGLKKIVSIRASINIGLIEQVTKSFPGILPVERPLVAEPENRNPNLLAGFIDAE